MKPWKVLVVVALVSAVAVAVAIRKSQQQPESAASSAATSQALPRLVDLGSTTCVPCKQMAPILEELKREYAGRMAVEFIDVARNPEAAKRYKIELIPTQVFLDAAGKELDRHVGFWSKDDILGNWRRLGVSLAGPPKMIPATATQPQAKSGGS